jgi:hypothetical protein
MIAGALGVIYATPSKNLLKKSVYVERYTSTREYAYEFNDKDFSVKVNETNTTTYTNARTSFF